MERNIDFESERNQLTRKAWGVTITYAVALLALACFPFIGETGADAYLKMKPNEVGDLLAGIAGPVAFIWLLYGYFLQGIAIKQQAEELSQNTRALHLAVEQQRELANSTSAQATMMQNSLRPKFALRARYRSGSEVGILIKNLGGTATNLHINTSPDLGDVKNYRSAFLERDQEIAMDLKNVIQPGMNRALGKNFDYRISIGFNYGPGLTDVDVFEYKDHDGGGAFAVFEKVENSR